MALDSEHKVRSILGYVFVSVILILMLAWLWAGGWANIRTAVADMPNPLDIIWGESTATYEVDLPWQLNVPQGPDISGLVEGSAGAEGSPEEQLAQLQEQYDALQRQAQDPRAKGAPSPYAGSVSLSAAGAAESGADEYVELSARSGGAVDISGWILESALTGKRAVIPSAAQPYILGLVNRVAPVMLEAGHTAYVATGPSPIGISFQENMCTGYLAQTQHFTPSLANACPSPSQVLPATAENMQRYGIDCIDFVSGIPQCTVLTALPASLSPACRTYIANALSYNGCVSANQTRPLFERDTWRLYLGISGDLWHDRHDVIRLLDASGRIVDAVSY